MVMMLLIKGKFKNYFLSFFNLLTHKNMTIWDALKNNWKIRKSELKDLGINPIKTSGDITYDELASLAEHLDITISELINHTDF